VKLLFNDGNQHVGGHDAPDLRLHGVLARPQKTFDTQVLFDLEEQFHLPAALVQRGDSQRRQRRVVGQEHEGLARFWILVSNTPQMFGIIFRDVKPLETNRLIADDASGSVDFARRSLHGLRRSFGTLSEWVEVPAGIVAQIMGHKPSAIAEKHYIQRELDLLHLWHVKIESWILEQAGIEFVPVQAGLRAVK